MTNRRLEAIVHGTFGVAPVVFTIGGMFMWLQGDGHLFAYDFHHTFWPGARQLLQGTAPYAFPHLPTQPFTYPAVGALLLAPFGLLPLVVGELIFTLLNVVALLIAMYLLEVRDWRLYGLVFLWLPVVIAWETANVTLLLLLGAAIVWRFRNRPVVLGLAVSVLISAKPIMWPLALWLLGTRRYRALAWTVVSGLVMNVMAWGILGFGQLHRYQMILSQLAHRSGHEAYTAVALLLQLHVPSSAAYIVGLTPGVLVCAACLWLARSGRERAAMALCVAAVLLCSPIVWLHYFALLIVPLALVQPRLSGVWAIPLAMWVCIPTNFPASWQIAVALLSVGALVAVCARVQAPTNTKGLAEPLQAAGAA